MSASSTTSASMLRAGRRRVVVEGSIYIVISLRNVGPGIGVI